MCLLNFTEVVKSLLKKRREKNQLQVNKRVVEFGVLADGLKCCTWCGQPLRLSNCIGKQFFNFYS